MKPRNTLILLGVLVALGAYVYFFEMRKTEKPAANEPPAILSIAPDSVEKFEVKFVTATVSLSKGVDLKWTLQNPAKPETDQARVAGVVETLTALKAVRKIADTSSDLGAYGLQQPKLEAVLGLKGNTTETVSIGDKTPSEDAYYATVKSKPGIYTISAGIVDDLQQLALDPPVPKPTPTPLPTIPILNTPVISATPTPAQ